MKFVISYNHAPFGSQQQATQKANWYVTRFIRQYLDWTSNKKLILHDYLLPSLHPKAIKSMHFLSHCRIFIHFVIIEVGGYPSFNLS